MNFIRAKKISKKITKKKCRRKPQKTVKVKTDGLANVNKPHTRIDEKSLENLAAAGHSFPEIARRMNVEKLYLFDRLAESPELDAAYSRGVEVFNNHNKSDSSAAEAATVEKTELVIAPRFAHTLEEISEHGHSKDLITKVTEKLTGAKPVPQPEEIFINPPSAAEPKTKEIRLSSGTIKISLDFDLFETTHDERDFLFNLVENVQRFEKMPEVKGADK